jgi:hypothetical protein
LSQWSSNIQRTGSADIPSPRASDIETAAKLAVRETETDGSPEVENFDPMTRMPRQAAA